MFCKNCGNEIKEDAAFCDKCGKSINETNNKSKKNSFSKRFLVSFIGAIILLVCIFVIPNFVRGFSIGYKQSHYINTVKNGAFLENRDVTVGTMLETILKDIKWETIVAEDNNYYVNVKGNLNDNDVLIQFKILQDDHWSVNALEINGNPEPIDNIQNDIYNLYINAIQ